MRGFVCIIVLLLNSFALKAQEGGAYWITPFRQCFAEEVVFVRNLFLESKSLKAQITIASEQQFTLFVNQRNVSIAVLEPFRSSPSLSVKAQSYDITHFLHPGNNTIAIVCTPQSNALSQPTIAVDGAITDKWNRTKRVISNQKWYCLFTGAFWNDDDQWVMSQGNNLHSLLEDTSFQPNCMPVVTTKAASAGLLVPSWTPTHVETHYKVVKTLIPRQIYQSSDIALFVFDKPFNGFIRITFRDTKSGEWICANNVFYRCLGVYDEQLSINNERKQYKDVVIWGDSSFAISQITKVEGLVVEPQTKVCFQSRTH